MSDIFDTVVNTIREVAGDAIDIDRPVSRATSINDDLELESIELVVIAEKLQEIYGDGVDFADWLSEKEIDEIIGLTVGDIADYIEQCSISK